MSAANPMDMHDVNPRRILRKSARNGRLLQELRRVLYVVRRLEYRQIRTETRLCRLAEELDVYIGPRLREGRPSREPAGGRHGIGRDRLRS